MKKKCPVCGKPYKSTHITEELPNGKKYIYYIHKSEKLFGVFEHIIEKCEKAV